MLKQQGQKRLVPPAPRTTMLHHMPRQFAVTFPTANVERDGIDLLARHAQSVAPEQAGVDVGQVVRKA